MFAKLLPAAFPAAEIVDGESAMRRARRCKTVAEVAEIRASVALADACLAAAETQFRAGVSERRLTGAFMEHMARAGVTTPSSQDVAWITSPEHPWRRGDRDRPLADGDLVVLAGGVVRGGYTGELARTHAVGGGHAALFDRLATLRAELLAVCRPGVPGTALIDVYEAAGVTPPPVPIARGLGLGFDLPIVTAALADTAAAEAFAPGEVVALTSFVWERGAGAAITIDAVHITHDDPELLSPEPLRSEDPT
jgi:Xaa-Pro aminopeptidase